jgi:peroxiredoxin
MTEVLTGLIILLLIAGAGYLYFRKRAARPVPEQLRQGQPLPEFAALDEAGNSLDSARLRGTPVVMIFVRGNWCPFCSRQVKNLTAYYKDIVDLGARLIFVDESLTAARELGLLLESGVPGDYYPEYGRDTIWPTSLVIDAHGIIRFVTSSTGRIRKHCCANCGK